MRKLAQKLYFPTGCFLGFALSWFILGSEASPLSALNLQMWLGGDATLLDTLQLAATRLGFSAAGGMFFGVLTNKYSPMQFLMGAFLMAAGFASTLTSAGVFLDFLQITTSVPELALIVGLALTGLFSCAVGMSMHPSFFIWLNASAYAQEVGLGRREDMSELEWWYQLQAQIERRRQNKK